jgi:hypothetical protein
MSHGEVEVQVAPTRRAGRELPAADAPAVHRSGELEPAAEGGAGLPEGDLTAPLGPTPEAARTSEPLPESPPEPTQRSTRKPSTAPVLVPFDSALPGVKSAEIRAELSRRQRRVPKLMTERDQIIQQLEAIESALNDMGEDAAVPRPSPEPRASRTRLGTSLKEAVASVVQPGETATPSEVMGRVRASGYVSTAANLGQMIAVALAKDERFERASRGVYRRIAG